MSRKRSYLGGFTLVEVMVASLILTVVSLSLLGVLGNFGKVITSSREITIANHLAQEKLESLRALSFYQIMVTSSTQLDAAFSPPLQYDNGYYPPETLQTGGLRLTRRVFIEKVDTPMGTVENMGYPHPDTGLKRIHVYITWQRPDGTWKKITMSNLAANPDREALDKRIYGYVTNSVTGLPVSGALVQARRNPGWGSYTDSTGYYSFQATDASMILISNKYAYYEYTSNQFAINYGDNLKSFTMVPISSAMVTGYVVTTSGLLISQVNCKWHATSDVEYVELYNGSTTTINLTGTSVTHVDKWDVETVIVSTWVNTTIPAQGYFLFLGSQFGTDTVAPNGKTADAYYTALMSHAQQGGVILKNSAGTVLDKVAWGSAPQTAPAAATEGSGFDPGGGGPGIDQGKSIVRKAISSTTAADVTPPSGAHLNSGNAWDTQNNSFDFVLISTTYPRNTVNISTPIGGTGLAGAVVSADDGISASTVTLSSGAFTLVMATGAWTVSGASTSVMGQKSVSVPTSGTSGVVIVATSPSTVGFVAGTVRQFGTTPFPNMLVQADPGGYTTFSNSQGIYTLALPAGEEYFITGNPNFYDADWNTAVTPDAISVQAGVFIDTIDLNIWKNAYISGRITTNGVDGVPGIAVVALGQYSNGNSAMTDAAGYYMISGLRLIGNPYTLYPSLVEGQSSTPATYTGLTLVQGTNLTGKDFTLNLAYVTLAGSATYSGAPITSGVNIMASSNTVSSSSPPDITFALRNGSVKYYQAVTGNSGTYAMPVIGGTTYYMVAWYTTPSTTTAQSLTVYIAPTVGNSSCHFNWR